MSLVAISGRSGCKLGAWAVVSGIEAGMELKHDTSDSFNSSRNACIHDMNVNLNYSLEERKYE